MSDTVTSPSSPAFLQNGRRHPPSRPLLSDFDKRHCGNSEPFVQSPDHFERVAFSSLAPEVDAQQLEDAFKSRLATLATGEVDLKSPAQSPTSKRQKAKKIENGPLADGIDKSRLKLSEPRRIRDRNQSKLSPSTLVLFAGDVLRMPTTSDTRKVGHSVERSATSSPSRCAAAIIVRRIDLMMKPHGGAKLESTPSKRPGRFGPRQIRFGRLPKPRILIHRPLRE